MECLFSSIDEFTWFWFNFFRLSWFTIIISEITIIVIEYRKLFPITDKIRECPDVVMIQHSGQYIALLTSPFSIIIKKGCTFRWERCPFYEISENFLVTVKIFGRNIFSYILILFKVFKIFSKVTLFRIFRAKIGEQLTLKTSSEG